MKAKLLALATVSLICSNFAEARFYIGVEGGYTAAPRINDIQKLGTSNEVKFVSQSFSDIKNAFKDVVFAENNGSTQFKPSEGYSVGINFGSEHLFLKDYLGFRWGASLGYTALKQEIVMSDLNGVDKMKTDYSFLDAGLSLDAMINFYSSRVFSIGVFGGAELGYHYLLAGKCNDERAKDTMDFKTLAPSRHSLDLVGRVGITTMFADHHRVEFMAKLPIGYVMAGKASDVKLTQAIARTTLSAGYKFVF